MLRDSEIEGEPITILGYRRAEPEPFRDGFHVLEIVRSSGAHALILSRAKVVNAQVEAFFTKNPSEPCAQRVVVRRRSKANPDRMYWTLEPALVDVGDPDDLAVDGDESPTETDQEEDEGHEEELDRQVREADQEHGGDAGLHAAPARVAL